MTLRELINRVLDTEISTLVGHLVTWGFFACFAIAVTYYGVWGEIFLGLLDAFQQVRPLLRWGVWIFGGFVAIIVFYVISVALILPLMEWWQRRGSDRKPTHGSSSQTEE